MSGPRFYGSAAWREENVFPRGRRDLVGLNAAGEANRCGDLHPSAYVAGIDFFCDGSASSAQHKHDRVVVASFRHATCEAFEGYDDAKWWMKPLEDGTLPEDPGPDGRGGKRVSLQCTKCPVDVVLKLERVDSLMTEVWSRHARGVERRNVTTLLT